MLEPCISIAVGVVKKEDIQASEQINSLPNIRFQQVLEYSQQSGFVPGAVDVKKLCHC